MKKGKSLLFLLALFAGFTLVACGGEGTEDPIEPTNPINYRTIYAVSYTHLTLPTMAVV